MCQCFFGIDHIQPTITIEILEVSSNQDTSLYLIVKVAHMDADVRSAFDLGDVICVFAKSRRVDIPHLI
jgi:hypothetical protein